MKKLLSVLLVLLVLTLVGCTTGGEGKYTELGRNEQIIYQSDRLYNRSNSRQEDIVAFVLEDDTWINKKVGTIIVTTTVSYKYTVGESGVYVVETTKTTANYSYLYLNYATGRLVTEYYDYETGRYVYSKTPVLKEVTHYNVVKDHSTTSLSTRTFIASDVVEK